MVFVIINLIAVIGFSGTGHRLTPHALWSLLTTVAMITYSATGYCVSPCTNVSSDDPLFCKFNLATFAVFSSIYAWILLYFHHGSVHHRWAGLAALTTLCSHYYFCSGANVRHVLCGLRKHSSASG